MNSLKYSTQTIGKKDIISVSKVLKSELLTQGPITIKFENKIKNLVGSKYALTVNSGSSALLLACKVLSLKSGDLFWTVPNSFVATANCGILCGLKIGFVDIDTDTWNISVEKLENKLKIAKKKINIGPNVKVNFVKDRPGHDLRYALDSNKIKKKLKWKPNTKFLKGLKKTFMWYFNNNKYYKSLPKKDIIKRLGVKK